MYSHSQMHIFKRLILLVALILQLSGNNFTIVHCELWHFFHAPMLHTVTAVAKFISLYAKLHQTQI